MTELDELKQILIGDDLRSIDGLRERMGDPRRRAEDIAEVLSDSIAINAERGPGLSYALQEPVTECVKIAARKHTSFFADALFPVIMPAIRRAIAEALRSFVQTVNETVEHTVSLRGLRWRWESLRTGIPFHEIVLKHALIYRVEQVFLIHNASGLLIDHVAHPDAKVKDSDAVSAMFTAIEDFVRDSFEPDKQGELDTVEISGRTVWLVHSPYAMMACVIRGIAPVKLREQLNLIVEEIDQEFGPLLEYFDSNRSALVNVTPYLERALRLELKTEQERAPARKLSPVLIVVTIAVVGALFGLISDYLQDRRFAALRNKLEDTSGVVVIDAKEGADKYLMRGLRDPLALEPSALLESVGLTADDVTFNMTSYHSMDKAIVLKRAHRLLKPPKGVRLALANGVLHASGTAPRAWIDQSLIQGAYIAGIDGVDTSKLRAGDEDSLARVLGLLAPPDGVRVDFQGGVLAIGGRAPWRWIASLSHKLSQISSLEQLDVAALKSREAEEMKRLAERLNPTSLYFTSGTMIREDSQQALEQLTADLKLLSRWAKVLAAPMAIKVLGYSDGVDSLERNIMVREKRARFIHSRLMETGLDPHIFTVVVDKSQAKPGYDPERRRVTLTVSIAEPDMSKLLGRWLH